MKFSKKYKKLLRQYRKKLIKIAKNTRPWDYGFMCDYVYEHLKFMRDYYELNENVWGEDLENTRLNTIKEAIQLYEDYTDNIMYKYWKFGDSTVDADGTFHSGMVPLINPDDHENSVLEETERENCWKQLFELLRDKMRGWWD